eukprot:TRINITY_DN6014_c0_g1_i1.p1 TRINITY_DN6014_c0_g1~~TRINITY_DN6014_c0_g1_i1.p1  ORF type:complete len:385 (-),score=98.62 TRINITY_DN6014_c0_g1_i1:65-1219(-)
MEELKFMKERKSRKQTKISLNLISKAKCGKEDSKLELMFAYCNGINFIKYDKEESKRMAVELFTKGNLFARALVSFFGWDVKQDYKEALGYLEKYLKNTQNKKKRSFSKAMIGIIYNEGLGVDKDHNKANKYFRESNKYFENSISMSYIGENYAYGNGLKQNRQRGIKYLKRAIVMGDCNAMVKLAVLYDKLGNVDAQHSIELLEKSLKYNSPIAPFYLASYYKQGKGVIEDQDQSYKLYMLGMKRGCSKSINKLGLMHQYGDVDKDLERAIQFYHQSISLGNSDAMFNLGYCYQHGEGLEKDYKQANYWFEKSLERKNSLPIDFLAHNYKHGLGVEKNGEKACSIYITGISISEHNREKYKCDLNKLFLEKRVAWSFLPSILA